MSYFDEISTGAQHYGSASTPLLHDIYAIQEIYGTNLSTRAGDTVYGFNSTADRDVFDFTKNTNPVIAIWDGGGIDTLDLSGANNAVRLDLEAGAFSDLAGMTKNVAIAYKTWIENAIGGDGDDVIVGNLFDNVLRGGEGDDELYGEQHGYLRTWSVEEDADELNGGAGDDFLVGGAGGDEIHGGSGVDRIYGHRKAEVPDDWLYDDTDYLYGGDGGDVIHGGFGDDWIYGDGGQDDDGETNHDGAVDRRRPSFSARKAATRSWAATATIRSSAETVSITPMETAVRTPSPAATTTIPLRRRRRRHPSRRRRERRAARRRGRG